MLSGDQLPQSICEDCFNLLEKFVTFRKTCVKTEINLLQVCNDTTRLVKPKDEFQPPIDTNYPIEINHTVGSNEISVKNEDNTFKNETIDDDDSDLNYNISGPSDFSDSDAEPLIKLKKTKKETSESSTNPPKPKSKRKKWIEKPGEHKCEICEKIFKNNSGISRHLRLRHKQKPFKCPICSKNYYYEPQFKKHEQSHKELKCEYCEENFLTQKLYDEHLQTHGLEKPYSCLQCDRYFKTKRVSSFFKFCNNHGCSS